MSTTKKARALSHTDGCLCIKHEEIQNGPTPWIKNFSRLLGAVRARVLLADCQCINHSSCARRISGRYENSYSTKLCARVISRGQRDFENTVIFLPSAGAQIKGFRLADRSGGIERQEPFALVAKERKFARRILPACSN